MTLRPPSSTDPAQVRAELVLPRVEVQGGVVKLSPQENALVVEIARGLTNREAAAALGRTEAAVRSQLSRVYRKLRLRRRAQLIMMFRG